MTNSRFSIRKTTQPAWQERQLSFYPEQKRWVQLALPAWETIAAHTGWGEDTLYNQAEQGGLLIGLPYRDQAADRYWTQVSYALPAHDADGSMKHLHFNHDVWHKLLQTADRYEPLRVVGWYHTHPKHLRVYFSDTDRNTQHQFFYQPWHIGLVLNPQQRILSAFRGCESEEVPVISVCD